MRRHYSTARPQGSDKSSCCGNCDTQADGGAYHPVGIAVHATLDDVVNDGSP